MAMGRGVPMWKVLVGGIAGVTLVTGLAAGLAVEDTKRGLYESRLSDLRSELKTAKQVTNQINVIPPNEKGFIN